MAELSAHNRAHPHGLFLIVILQNEPIVVGESPVTEDVGWAVTRAARHVSTRCVCPRPWPRASEAPLCIRLPLCTPRAGAFQLSLRSVRICGYFWRPSGYFSHYSELGSRQIL
jgi:hypothetical protein